KKRIVFENRDAIAIAPFVSREPFELRIFPKKHLPYFENVLDVELENVVDALQSSLRLIEKKLRKPDYNFFVHTAPVKDKGKYRHYHWHIEVIPKTNISAGFELGTGIEINVVDPDNAARFLRAKKRR
ncbi:MAG TPA: HIT domain-containing protein, partial [Candidatus Paceibacterota bacterium]|nr:HIT domain-containing protein [Candidatus Paceibacterota bacterium]